jgi:hypothetical protein
VPGRGGAGSGARLGHEGCGAVQAALQAKFHGARDRSRIEELLQNILPALDEVDPKAPPDGQLAAAVEADVRWTLRRIRATPETQAREAEGIMKLVGAVLSLSTGVVRFLDDSPAQGRPGPNAPWARLGAVATALSPLRRLRRFLGPTLVVAITVLGSFQARTIVWCQTEAGHAEIEELEAGCCGIPGPAAGCTPDLASTESRGAGERNGLEGGACRDVLVEAPTGLPLGGKLLALPTATLRPFALCARAPRRTCPASSREADGARAAAHELTLATILRV